MYGAAVVATGPRVERRLLRSGGAAGAGRAKDGGNHRRR